MRNIILVGFMGTGKTTVGKMLAAKLGYEFVDIDDEIEKEQGVAISYIFSELGEPYFRLLERDKVKALVGRERVVVSAGGGVVLDLRNVEDLKRAGAVVCLSASAEVIMKRVGGSTNRPLLRVPDPMAKIRELMEVRAPYYRQADICIDTSDMSGEETVEEIIRLVR